MAHGKYLAIAESDDIPHPQRLEMQAKLMRAVNLDRKVRLVVRGLW